MFSPQTISASRCPSRPDTPGCSQRALTDTTRVGVSSKHSVWMVSLTIDTPAAGEGLRRIYPQIP